MATKYDVSEITADFLDCVSLSGLLCSKVKIIVDEYEGDEITEDDFKSFSECWQMMQQQLQNITMKSICGRMRQKTNDGNTEI